MHSKLASRSRTRDQGGAAAAKGGQENLKYCIKVYQENLSRFGTDNVVQSEKEAKDSSPAGKVEIF